jgi:hypothetical protein
MKKLIVASLLFFAVAYMMLTYYFNDLQINKYPDRETVLAEKAIEHGFVPALLPSSAYDIEETHDIDTNQLFGRFYYKETDEKVVMTQLASLPESNGTYTGKDFLFRIDTEKNTVKYRNKPQSH